MVGSPHNCTKQGRALTVVQLVGGKVRRHVGLVLYIDNPSSWGAGVGQLNGCTEEKDPECPLDEAGLPDHSQQRRLKHCLVSLSFVIDRDRVNSSLSNNTNQSINQVPFN